MNNTPQEPRRMSRLMWLFAIIYIGEGVAQLGGLVGQPMNQFLLKVYDWNSTQIEAFLYLAAIPWLIKPIFGIVSDFVPIFGYRRKSYLLLANGLAAIGYLALTGMTTPTQIIIALTMTTVGMALSSTVCGALVVESGKRSGLSKKYVSQQWLWFWIANVCAAFAGGMLCRYLAPGMAVNVAAFVVAGAVIGVTIACWSIAEEQPTTVNWEGVRTSLGGLKEALRSRTLWFVGAFIFCYFFSPGFGLPLYVHMTKTLGFEQGFIGILGSLNGIGHIVGAFAFKWLAERLSMKQLIAFSILFGAVAQASYVFLGGPVTAVVLYFFGGVAGMISMITVMSLATDYCPDGTEGFMYAVLMSIRNITQPLSGLCGAILYDYVFNHNLTPLILVSAGVTLFALILIPILRLQAPNNRDGTEQ